MTVSYGQDIPNDIIKVLRVEKIDAVGKQHLISCIDNQGKKLLIWVHAENRRTNKKNHKNTNIEKIEIGREYSFELKLAINDIGFLETGELYIEDKLIWSKEKSDFTVYKTRNLQGLYYIE